MRDFVLLVLACGWAMAQEGVAARVEARAGRFGDISRQIWEQAEVGFQETRSSAILRDELEKNGFRIDDGVAGMPTAFVASWGSGKPVIVIMGEYDALPGLSQDTVTQRKPLVEGATGHGCGHNLFGSASALAAIAVKEQMQARQD